MDLYTCSVHPSMGTVHEIIWVEPIIPSTSACIASFESCNTSDRVMDWCSSSYYVQGSIHAMDFGQSWVEFDTIHWPLVWVRCSKCQFQHTRPTNIVLNVSILEQITNNSSGQNRILVRIRSLACKQKMVRCSFGFALHSTKSFRNCNAL